MKKGRFGFYPWLYPLLAFLFAILGQPVLCLLVAGFAIAAEQHAWAARQSIQALLLGVASSLISVVLNTLSGLFYAMPVVGSYLGRAFDVIDSLVWVAILVFAIVAIARVLKGQDANIPGISTLANKAYGLIAPQMPSAPGYQPPQGQPNASAAPMPGAPVAPQGQPTPPSAPVAPQQTVPGAPVVQPAQPMPSAPAAPQGQAPQPSVCAPQPQGFQTPSHPPVPPQAPQDPSKQD